MAFAALAVVAAPSAGAYGWPVAPFDVAHPVRAHFGDPRTRYFERYDPERSPTSGNFTFHNGVDISASPGASVYPVASGVVSQVRSSRIVVKAARRRTFQYIHVVPRVAVGDRVSARRTVLGTVEEQAAHVHLSELVGGRVVNPLLRGHLSPYADRTVPKIVSIHARTSSGKRLETLAVSGSVSLEVDAFDRPWLPVPGAWHGLPVTPAYVSWSLHAQAGYDVVPTTFAVDFRYLLPFKRDFWRVYGPGTFQNKPRYGGARYVFRLTPDLLDTRRLQDGRYSLKVTVGDVRGNQSSRVVALTICNAVASLCTAAGGARPR